jgi:hypothetical protein
MRCTSSSLSLSLPSITFPDPFPSSVTATKATPVSNLSSPSPSPTPSSATSTSRPCVPSSFTLVLSHRLFPQIFRAIHNSYIAYLSNPFTSAESENPSTLAAPIRSKKFNKAMDDIAGKSAAAPEDD